MPFGRASKRHLKISVLFATPFPWSAGRKRVAVNWLFGGRSPVSIIYMRESQPHAPCDEKAADWSGLE